jgi:hypothetical protein
MNVSYACGSETGSNLAFGADQLFGGMAGACAAHCRLQMGFGLLWNAEGLCLLQSACMSLQRVRAWVYMQGEVRSDW